MRGWVYIISNPSMPDLVKIGFSMKDPDLRAQEFGGTGVPHSYVVEWDILLEDPRTVEQKAHKYLIECREAKEWFRCSVIDAILAVKKAANGVTQYGERGGPIKLEELPFPFEINDGDLAYEISCEILEGGKYYPGHEIDEHHPKSKRHYFGRALDLGSVNAWIGIAYSLASGSFRRRQDLPYSFDKNLTDIEAEVESDKIFKQVFPKLLEKARFGDIEAARYLGDFYLRGLGGLPINNDLALHWLTVAANGDDDGFYAFEIGEKFSRGIFGGVPNHVEAFKWYKVSAKKNCVSGIAQLAIAYRDGIGTVASLDAAIAWAQQAYEINPYYAAAPSRGISDLLKIKTDKSNI